MVILRFVSETATELSNKANDPLTLLVGFLIVLVIGVYLISRLDDL